ncbi:MAG: hypothetical protein H0X30_20520 [Anaerolineae bacterium]|nr:hypothetical protein [Anaerolineae bacterium]
MITDRGVAVFIFSLACLVLFWIFSVTQKESGLSPHRIIWSRRFGFCLVGLAFIPVVQSFILKAPIDSQLFESKECNIACWNDLVVGQTNLDTLRASLKKKFNRFEELDTYKSTWKLGTKSFKAQTDDGMQVHIDTVDGVISQMELSAQAFSLSLNDIINHLGKTDDALVYYTVISNDFTIIDSRIALFYPDKGYVIYATSPSNVSNNYVETCITGNEWISGIRVVEPGSIDQVLIYLDSPPGPPMVFPKDLWRSIVLKGLKPLSTFGCFKMLYPPRSDSYMQTW